MTSPSFGHSPWMLIAVLLAPLACDRGEYARAALQAKQREWAARIDALNAGQSRSAGILASYPARADDDRDRAAARLRAAAGVEGLRQSLVDVELAIKDRSRQVSAAIDKGGVDGQEALREAVESIDGYLRAHDEELQGVERALAQLPGPGSGSKTATAAR